MKQNKLLETILVLDNLERKRFRNIIKNKKRKSLLALYELCLNRIEKNLSLPEKEEVFKILFGESYSKKSDFLLRNEYRLLTDEAESFLRSTAMESQFPGLCEAARLRRILQSGNKTLFKKEFDAVSAKFADDAWFWVAVDPTFLNYFVTADHFSEAHYARIKTKTDEARNRLNIFYNRLLTDYEIRKGYADKVYSIISDIALEQPFKSQSVHTTEPDELVEYRKLKAEAYYLVGEEKIAVLLKANEILKTSKSAELGREESWWLQASIGLEYHLRYDFKHAVKHLDDLFQSPGIESFQRLTEAGLNYVSALMSCGDYEKAVRILVPYEQRMVTSKSIFYKYICLKSISLSFLRDGSSARRELNRVESHIADTDLVYWRVSMVLSFAVEHRWEDALNEFRNLVKTKNIKQNTKSDLENLVTVIDLLLKIGAQHDSGKKISAPQWQQCDQKLQEMAKSPSDYLHPPRLVHKLLHEMRPSELAKNSTVL